MSYRRLFLDTSFALALLSGKDRFHEQAKDLYRTVKSAEAIFVTTHILAEICDHLSGQDKEQAAQFIDELSNATNVRIVHIPLADFWEAFELYRQRTDKSWGLTDCISFKVMDREGIGAALTCDRHFEQAGYEALLLQDNV